MLVESLNSTNFFYDIIFYEEKSSDIDGINQGGFVINAIIGISIGWLLSKLLVRKDEREFKLWEQADRERDLLFRKLIELRDDPGMTDRKWAQWLPVFEYMDRHYAANNFLGVAVTPLSEFVRKQIDDNCYL